MFSQAEETQLQERLELSPGDLTNMLEAMSFIFEQSAYYSISVAALGAQLEKTGIVAAKIEVSHSSLLPSPLPFHLCSLSFFF